MLMLHMIIRIIETRLSVSRRKPTFIIKSLNFVKTNYNASDLVSVVLSGMFKYSRYNIMAFTARTFVFGRSKKKRREVIYYMRRRYYSVRA